MPKKHKIPRCVFYTLFGDVGNCRLFVPKKVSEGGVFEPSLLAKLRHWILAGGSTEANASRDMAYDTAMFDRVPWVFFWTDSLIWLVGRVVTWGPRTWFLVGWFQLYFLIFTATCWRWSDLTSLFLDGVGEKPPTSDDVMMMSLEFFRVFFFSGLETGRFFWKFQLSWP